ncbi:MAG: gamma-glutamyl-gamma-aminobutyrate hydrolase family protein [Actinomycetota bacterium]|nr:gamma-glutamyl-gamma-aminobutyrate hydrolase family protein [Actinomycetota bacterium]
MQQARIGVAAAQGEIGLLPVHAVNRVYVTAVRAAGGLPFIVPTLDPSDALAVVAELDGLVFSGGGDLEPAAYGGASGPELVDVDSERDRWELALLAAAEELGVPVLGVCRGLQAINVAAGGTLVPHLPDGAAEAHRVTGRDFEPVHSIEVIDGTMLHGLTGPSCGVNSMHHQAADRVGSGLRAVGFAPDGVIEALEDTRWGRTLGVQWHPELLTAQPEQMALWSWLVDAAIAWRSRRRGDSGTSGAAAGADLAVVLGEDPSATSADRAA